MLDHVLRSGSESVLDLGCGGGRLLLDLARQHQIKRLAGIDSSKRCLAGARSRIQADGDAAAERIELLHGSFVNPVPGLFNAKFDAVVMVETIEHVNPENLSGVEATVFTCIRPAIVIITTPNRDYNSLLGNRPGTLRHKDHKFEWGRVKFQSWARGVARRNSYQVAFSGIGWPDPVLGEPTQMAEFTLEE